MTLQLTWYAPDGEPTVFSATATDYVLLKRYNGFSFTPVTHRTTRFPFQNGVTIQNSDGEPREISFEIMIKADTLGALETLIENLSDQFNPLTTSGLYGDGFGLLVYEKANGDTRRIYCKASGSTLDMGVRNGTSQKAVIKLYAADPAWYSATSHIEYLAGSGDAMFPWSFPWVVGGIAPSLTLTNDGTLDAPITVIITGPITNPVLTNTTTSKVITITKDLAGGESFKLSTEIGEQYAYFNASGVAPVNGMPYVDVASEFFQLVPGTNVITLTNDAATDPAGASIEWSDRYVGV